MADKSSDGGMSSSKAARGQTIVRAYPLDTSTGNSGAKESGGKFATPGDAEITMKDTGLSRSLSGTSVAGPTPGRKDTTL